MVRKIKFSRKKQPQKETLAKPPESEAKPAEEEGPRKAKAAEGEKHKKIVIPALSKKKIGSIALPSAKAEEPAKKEETRKKLPSMTAQMRGPEVAMSAQGTDMPFRIVLIMIALAIGLAFLLKLFIR